MWFSLLCEDVVNRFGAGHQRPLALGGLQEVAAIATGDQESDCEKEEEYVARSTKEKHGTLFQQSHTRKRQGQNYVFRPETRLLSKSSNQVLVLVPCAPEY